MAETAPDLVEQALGNLVKQFAHPMDCLRELVQNSIDAGTPRIEIEVRFTDREEGPGVLEIEVADFGQGMDADIIDSQLTRLFSSAKEGDRGTIGKFGIGFTSVFAIEPVLVRVVTGRHGENWELLFHADRSFERRTYDGPVQGTTITLYKRMRRGQVMETVTDARDTLIRWCEHAQTPITFLDRTVDSAGADVSDATGGVADDATEVAPVDDVFAAFDSAPVAETINRPFELDDAELQIRHSDGEVECVVGYSHAPGWGFFSGGLTLLRSSDPGHLGDVYYPRVGHLSFKVRSRRIEHTLTRDNVIQDDAWFEAMDVVVAASRLLRGRLEERIATVAAEAGDVTAWHGFLAADIAHSPLPWDTKLFVDFGGRARSLAEVAPLGPFGREAWLIDRTESVLGKALWNRGLKVLPYHPATEAVLRAALPGQRVDDAAAAFKLTRPIESSMLPPDQERFFASVASHVGVATGNGVRVGVCEIDGGDSEGTLFVEGQAREGLFRRPARSGVAGVANRAFLRLSGLMMLQRHVLVNRRHPHVIELIALSADDVDLAGFVLAQALLVEEEYGEAAFDALAMRAAREWLRV